MTGDDGKGDCLGHTDLSSDHMKSLLKMVIERRNMVRKVLYKERLDSEFRPYRMVSNIAQLEQYLWNYNSRTSCSSASSLRNRFQFLMTFSGMVRMESLYLADICDLCGVFYYKRAK